jgi:ribonucleoside-diphosphate reductase alpha chain
LKFDGQTYQRVRALDVWATIMESNWDWAEPGVLFLDRTNRMNPLAYCETIFSTNPSMPAGTKVHTSRGILPIESLEGQTFKVKSMDGVWASAKCFLSGEDEPILEIDYGGGRSVRCTPQHSWPVLLNGRYVKVRADELVPGDLIPTNRNEPLGHDSDSPLGYQDGLVTGLWFGNGCAGERTDDGRAYLGFSFNRQDTELAEAVATYFGITVSEREAEFSLQVSRDGAARQFMTTVGADLSDPKGKLPAAVWTAGDDFVRGFVSGLFSADGWVGCRPPNTKIVFTNRSADVCREVAVLLGFHGVTSLLRESVAKLNGKEYPRADLHISHNGAKRFARVFRLDSRRKQSSLETLVGIECRAHVGADHLRVEAVRPAGRAKVWDISVQHRQHVFPTEYTYTGNCGEQPLPPHGACLLGSLNVVKYLVPSYARGLHPFGDNGDPRRNGHSRYVRGYELNLDLFREDARAMVRAFDNVIENTVYPLPRQQQEARDKRRMGCGVTGMANALEVCGFPYGTSEYLEAQDRVLTLLRDTAYETSVELAREKGSFPLFDAEKWLASGFAQTLPEDIRGKIRKHGLRNGLLLSLAPTGTLSLTADNVSSCIEPPPFLETERLVNLEGGQTSVTLRDYALENYGVRGRTAGECSPAEHVAVLCAAQKYVDSSISKTINCAGARGGEPQPGEITFAEFKEVYWQAWQGGAKGCTTYNMNGKRAGIMQEKKPARRPSSSAAEAAGDGDTVVDEIPAFRQGAENCPLPEGGSACFVDPTTGTRTCDS